jgi:hypothetical protein
VRARKLAYTHLFHLAWGPRVATGKDQTNARQGIAYDTGFVINGRISRESFDPDGVKRAEGLPLNQPERIVEASARVNDFLRDAVAAVRERFWAGSPTPAYRSSGSTGRSSTSSRSNSSAPPSTADAP